MCTLVIEILIMFQEKQFGESKADSDTEESDDDLPELELSVGNKDAFVLEVLQIYQFGLQKVVQY